MAKKKTTKRKSTKRDPEIAERNKKIAIWSATLLLTGTVFVAGAMGVGELDRTAAEAIVTGTPEVQINWPTLNDGTVWMPHQEQQNIHQSIVRSIEGGAALSNEPLREAVITLQRSGWVEGIPQAHWTSDGTIVLDAHWRIPGAVVRVGQREVLIDWDRFVLPLDYAIGQSNQRYFVNVDAPLPRVGEQWSGTDLMDGMALLRELRKNGLLEQVDGFDLGSGSNSGTIKIITTRGTHVVWGAGPGRERPGEQVSSVKIERLSEIYKRAGLLDGGVGYIDIRGDDIMIKKYSD
tara:strand:- start:40204 stop:41079 length:876 start_codon:yes stop_codon:yes gene_type:complete